MKFFKKTLKIWIGINKDGSLSLHAEVPFRDEDRGIWVSKYPFCNSVMYNELSKMITKSSMTWQSDPEYMEINI